MPKTAEKAAARAALRIAGRFGLHKLTGPLGWALDAWDLYQWLNGAPAQPGDVNLGSGWVWKCQTPCYGKWQPWRWVGSGTVQNCASQCPAQFKAGNLVGGGVRVGSAGHIIFYGGPDANALDGQAMHQIGIVWGSASRDQNWKPTVSHDLYPARPIIPALPSEYPVHLPDPHVVPPGEPSVFPKPPPLALPNPNPYPRSNPNRDPYQQPVRGPNPRSGPDPAVRPVPGVEVVPSPRPGDGPSIWIDPPVDSLPGAEPGPREYPSPRSRGREDPHWRGGRGRGRSGRGRGRNKKDREKKFDGRSKGAKAFLAGLGLMTEGLDGLGALWKALPPSKRTLKKGHRTRPDEMAGDLWNAFGDGDLNWPDFLARAAENLAKNEIGDRIAGGIGNASKKAASRNPVFQGSRRGFGTGPAL